MTFSLSNPVLTRGLQCTNLGLYGYSNLHSLLRNWKLSKVNAQLANIEHSIQKHYPLEIQRLFSYYVEFWISSFTQGKYCASNIRELYAARSDLTKQKNALTHSGFSYFRLKNVVYITMGLECAHRYLTLANWISKLFS